MTSIIINYLVKSSYCIIPLLISITTDIYIQFIHSFNTNSPVPLVQSEKYGNYI